MAYPFPIVECPEYRKYICIPFNKNNTRSI